MSKGLSAITAGALLALVLCLPVRALEADTAATGEDPRIGYYTSETEDWGFVLDRSGDMALLKYDTSPEVLVLTMVPGPQGATYLNNRLGETVLRLMPWGGATVYGDDGSEGGAFGMAHPVAPILPLALSSGESKEQLETLESELKDSARLELRFSAPELSGKQIPERKMASRDTQPLAAAMTNVLEKGMPAREPEQTSRAGALLDSANVVRLALVRLARDDLAHEAISERIRTVEVRSGDAPAIALEHQSLIVTCVPEEGYFGRLSSRQIERFLLENL